MRNTVAIMLVLGATLVSPLAAQPTGASLRATVPTALDVAGLHVVLNGGARRLVQQKTDGLLRHKPSFQARVDLADAAFPIIDRVLKQEGVPLDFHYLALQESALQGNAQSAHGAVGYWQLKRETATSLGLEVNDAVDERQHLVASTRAAARYLVRNNASLRNWLSALLSYNTGLGGVKPYVLPTDADATQVYITEDTSPYVLMFLAQKIAFEPYCGLNPQPPLRLQEFPAMAGQTLAAQAQTVYADPVALAVHNHWLLAPAVPAGRPYTLVVPVSDAAQAAGLLAHQRLAASGELLALPARSASNAAEVRLNDLRALIALPGETPADLARRGGQKLGEFLRHNEMTAFDAATPGRPYYLVSKRDVAAVEYYVVLPGETALDVAQKHGMHKRAVLAKNRLAPNDELRPGLVMWLQHTRPRSIAAEYRALPATASSGAAEAPAVAARPRADSEEGWGDAVAVPPVAPASASSAAAPEVAQLPPPVSAPASAPLADEPREPSPAPTQAVEAPPAAEAVRVSGTPAPPKPVTAAAPTPRPAAPVLPAAVSVPNVSFGAATHRVAAKETVYSISRLYQIPPATLMALNNLTPPAGLSVGQVLRLKPFTLAPVPVAAPPVAAPAQTTGPAGPRPAVVYVPKAAPSAIAATTAGAQHTVAVGETMYSIARRYAVTVADLQAWNAKPTGAVKVGEVLRVQPPTKSN